MPNIKIITHAKLRARERGASEDEIGSTINTGIDVVVSRGRKAKEKVFEYNNEWLGKEYAQKKIQAIFVEEYGAIVVITVKVFYGNWG